MVQNGKATFQNMTIMIRDIPSPGVTQKYSVEIPVWCEWESNGMVERIILSRGMSLTFDAQKNPDATVVMQHKCATPFLVSTLGCTNGYIQKTISPRMLHCSKTETQPYLVKMFPGTINF